VSAGGPLWQSPARVGTLAVYRNGVEGAADDTPIDFGTVSEPYGTPLDARTSGGTFCQPNGPGGYYSHNFNQRIVFAAPSGQRIRFTITLAKLDTHWQYGLTFVEPTGGNAGDLLVPTVYGDSSTNSGTFAAQSVPYVIETDVGQNTGDFWFASNPFSHQVRADGEWRVSVEFF